MRSSVAADATNLLITRVQKACREACGLSVSRLGHTGCCDPGHCLDAPLFVDDDVPSAQSIVLLPEPFHPEAAHLIVLLPDPDRAAEPLASIPIAHNQLRC